MYTHTHPLMWDEKTPTILLPDLCLSVYTCISTPVIFSLTYFSDDNIQFHFQCMNSVLGHILLGIMRYINVV